MLKTVIFGGWLLVLLVSLCGMLSLAAVDDAHAATTDAGVIQAPLTKSVSFLAAGYREIAYCDAECRCYVIVLNGRGRRSPDLELICPVAWGRR